MSIAVIHENIGELVQRQHLRGIQGDCGIQPERGGTQKTASLDFLNPASIIYIP